MQLTVLGLAMTSPFMGVRTAVSAAVDGRSEMDRAMEDFLQTAAVVVDEPVGEGITEPRRLTLERGGLQLRAIFKTIDQHSNATIRNDVTGELEADFSDSWKYEVAAYRLDRALGLGLVPVTVTREVDGKRGSLQEWVEGAGTFRDVVEEDQDDVAGDPRLLMVRLMSMYILDQIIANADRNYDNILVDLENDRLYLIDHSRSFRLSRTVEPPALQHPVRLSDRAAERLRGLDRAAIGDLIGDLVSRRQVAAAAARRDALLQLLAEHDLLPPEVGVAGDDRPRR